MNKFTLIGLLTITGAVLGSTTILTFEGTFDGKDDFTITYELNEGYEGSGADVHDGSTDKWQVGSLQDGFIIADIYSNYFTGDYVTPSMYDWDINEYLNLSNTNSIDIYDSANNSNLSLYYNGEIIKRVQIYGYVETLEWEHSGSSTNMADYLSDYYGTYNLQWDAISVATTSGSYSGTIDTITISQLSEIPEPATLALLATGALLRARRKA